MNIRRIAASTAITATALALAGCGGDDEPAADGPAVTVTVRDPGASIATTGFVVPTGEEVEVRLVNERDEAAGVALFVAPEGYDVATDGIPPDVEVAYEHDLEPGADETVEVSFDEPGDYAAAADPVSVGGVITGSGTFTVADE